MAWPNSQSAISALRTILFDGPKDKYAAGKKVLGKVDGVNATFKTFEYRRTQSFTTAVDPVGVFKNGVAVNPILITSDDTDSGIFTLSGAAIPSDTARDVITATYYYQFCTDTEIDTFLQNASTWLGFSSTYTAIPDGLNSSCLRFAAQEAYEMLAAKYSVRVSEIYQLEDSPSEEILKSIAAFKEMAEGFLEKAEKMRDDFYTRQGQSLAPNFGFQLGRIKDPTPRR